MRELVVERYLVRKLKALGARADKRITPGRRHASDRHVLFSEGRHDFVECKRPGAPRPRPGQAREHRRLRARGFNVFVIATHEDADAYIESRIALGWLPCRGIE